MADWVSNIKNNYKLTISFFAAGLLALASFLALHKWGDLKMLALTKELVFVLMVLCFIAAFVSFICELRKKP